MLHSETLDSYYFFLPWNKYIENGNITSVHHNPDTLSKVFPPHATLGKGRNPQDLLCMWISVLWSVKLLVDHMETYLPTYGEGRTREQAVLLTGYCCAGNIQSPEANTRLLRTFLDLSSLPFVFTLWLHSCFRKAKIVLVVLFSYLKK